MKKNNYKDYNINHNKKQDKKDKYINKWFSRLNERENMIKL